MKYLIVKYLIALFCSLAVLSVSAQAQTPAPAPSSADHIFVSGSVLAFNGPNGMTASSNIGAALQVTKSTSLGYEQVTIPSLNRTYRLGVANYTRPLCDLLGDRLSKRFVFDSCVVNVTFQGGLGKVEQKAPSPLFNVMAESVGVFASYNVAKHMDLQVVGVEWLHGGRHPSSVGLTTGLTFHF